MSEDVLVYLEDAYSFLSHPAIGKAIDEIKKLRRENRRLHIYRKAVHEICSYRAKSQTGYIMLAKQVVDWYEELPDNLMEEKLSKRIFKKEWLDAE